MMKWLEHRHWWRRTGDIDLHIPGGGRPTGWLTVEECRCGAVRTIEIYPGQAPIVRIAENTHKTTCATNNGPALPPGPCDCGAGKEGEA